MGGCLLAEPDSTFIQIGYNCPYRLHDMAERTLAYSQRISRRGTLKANLLYQGNHDRNQCQAALGYLTRITRHLHVGIEAEWLHTGIGDAHYESHNRLAARATLMAQAGPVRLTLHGGNRPLDPHRRYEYHLQCAWQPSPSLLAVAEVASEERWRLRTGLEYRFERLFYLRVGAQSAPWRATGGLGLRYRHYAIDFAAESHPALGLTPHLSMRLCF